MKWQSLNTINWHLHSQNVCIPLHSFQEQVSPNTPLTGLDETDLLLYSILTISADWYASTQLHLYRLKLAATIKAVVALIFFLLYKISRKTTCSRDLNYHAKCMSHSFRDHAMLTRKLEEFSCKIDFVISTLIVWRMINNNIRLWIIFRIINIFTLAYSCTMNSSWL